MSGDRRDVVGATTGADLILRNGRIATQGELHPFASALAVQNGQFVAVGDEGAVMRFKGSRTRVIDAQGRTVIPGLNDSHLHIIRGGLNYNLELRWDGVPSLAEAMRMLRGQAARTPPPQWVRVVGGFSPDALLACSGISLKVVPSELPTKEKTLSSRFMAFVKRAFR